MRFFGLFGNSVPSGELKTFGGEGGKGYSFFFFFSFLKYSAAPLRTLLQNTGDPSFLPYRFCFFLSSLCLLSVGKADWEGGQCWQGEKEGHIYHGLGPQCFQQKCSHLSIFPGSAIHLGNLQRCLFQEEPLCHNGLILSGCIKTASFLQLNTR